MYKETKKILVKLIPPHYLIRYEFFLRKILSIFYIGKSVRCNVCEGSFSNFIGLENQDNICPRCGSLARHRRLWQIVHNEVCYKREDYILDFSPSRMLQKKFKSHYPNYLSTDIQKNSVVDKHYDITNLPVPCDSFDHIICYHVLEHITDDHKALSELFRVLKKGGRIIIQTPFKDGAIYENHGLISKEERLIHFGQEDHVRIYSINGLKERLEAVGFDVKVFEYLEDIANIGFNAREYVLIGTK